MLFNSYVFLFLFLPLTLIGFFLFGKFRLYRTAIAWLVGASLFFYGWWNPIYLGLIIVSILVNYVLGIRLSRAEQHGAFQRKFILVLGVVFNLGLLGYFKYANFFVDILNTSLGMNLLLERVILPLAISFFTFQQIAYLVDAYRKQAQEHDFLRYCLFVTFFPQLIAGPIVHHKEMLPQFAKRNIFKLNPSHLAVGGTIFFAGLFKKVILADSIAAYATPVFDAAAQGVGLSMFEAWFGVLAYAMQLYFDFSGYSDMAIGIARMFGIRLPLNFHSPYKATNIAHFWRRWHMTLSRFLRDYLYIPLGGNRKGPLRRYLNLAITMILGGLWHGAGWTFVIWGALHGAYLIVNHAWQGLRRILGKPDPINRWWSTLFAKSLTFIAVCIAWVFFRADSLDTALRLLTDMFGGHGLALSGVLGSLAIGIPLLIVLLLIAWFAPNTQQLMARYRPALDVYRFPKLAGLGARIQWRPQVAWAFFVAVIVVWALLSLNQVSEFLYFQF